MLSTKSNGVSGKRETTHYSLSYSHSCTCSITSPHPFDALEDRAPGEGGEGLGHGLGGVAERWRVEGSLKSRRQPVDKRRGVRPRPGCRRPPWCGSSTNSRAAPIRGASSSTIPGRFGGDQAAPAGQGLDEHQRETLVERRQDADGRPAHEFGEFVLRELAVEDDPRRHGDHSFSERLGLVARIRRRRCEARDSDGSRSQPLKGVEE